MQKTYCKVAILSIRKSPNETSEMISQMLYGETCEIIEQKGDYAKIITDFDEVSGWVLLYALGVENRQGSRRVLHHKFAYLNGETLLSLGSEVYTNVEKIQNVDNATIIKIAKNFLNTPFLYGGRSIFGVDASALVQLVYKVLGVSLPRFAFQQAEYGTTLDFVEESEGGEIAFFDDENGEICHAGIMLSDYKILHCYGKVRVDSLDSTGIFNEELNKHTHKLRFIKRIVQ